MSLPTESDATDSFVHPEERERWDEVDRECAREGGKRAEGEGVTERERAREGE